jgi:iron complex transport system ATP-binding protein
VTSINGAAFYFNRKQYLFKGLSFDLARHETLAVLGANGAGKTTLLRCLMGFLRFKEGSASINGCLISSIKQADFWRLVSYVPQARVPVFGHSSLNMVVMGRSSFIGIGRQPGKDDIAAALETMSFLGIENIAEQDVSSLSGGQLQMVLIARALVKKPALLIMDEPESNLDLQNQLKVLNLIEKLRAERNVSIIINTHFPCHALRIADRTLLLGSNEYVFGKTEDVVDKNNIRKFYGVDTEILDVKTPCTRIPAVVPLKICDPIFCEEKI